MNLFDGKRPLYQKLAERLSNDIQQGVYAVGSLLPTEAEFCAQFNVSRQTVREAIRQLTEIGLVSRHQGVGTRVERSRLEEGYVQRLGHLPDLFQYVKDTQRKVLRTADVVASKAKVPLPGDPKLKWRVIEGLRFRENEQKPIAWTEIYVHPAYATVTGAKDRDRYPIYSLIERRYGIKAQTVQQEIAGVAIEPAVAGLLRVPAGSVGLSVQRQYVSTNDEIFEVTLSIHPADRYRYRMQLELDYSPGRGVPRGESDLG